MRRPEFAKASSELDISRVVLYTEILSGSGVGVD